MGMASTILLNATVDSVFQHWLLLTVDDKYPIHEGLRMVWERVWAYFTFSVPF